MFVLVWVRQRSMPHISPLALKNMTVFTLWEVSQGDNNWCDFNFRQKAFFQGGNWGNERFHTPVEVRDHLDLELERENQVLRFISVKESRNEYSGMPTARRPLVVGQCLLSYSSTH